MIAGAHRQHCLVSKMMGYRGLGIVLMDELQVGIATDDAQGIGVVGVVGHERHIGQTGTHRSRGLYPPGTLLKKEDTRLKEQMRSAYIA